MKQYLNEYAALKLSTVDLVEWIQEFAEWIQLPTDYKYDQLMKLNINQKLSVAEEL